ncbi:hypothetical protein ABK040_011232 [Willaertia magna]
MPFFKSISESSESSPMMMNDQILVFKRNNNNNNNNNNNKTNNTNNTNNNTNNNGIITSPTSPINEDDVLSTSTTTTSTTTTTTSTMTTINGNNNNNNNNKRNIYLLLGTMGSGKTTFLKQLNYLFENLFYCAPKTRSIHTEFIYENIIYFFYLIITKRKEIESFINYNNINVYNNTVDNVYNNMDDNVYNNNIGENKIYKKWLIVKKELENELNEIIQQGKLLNCNKIWNETFALQLKEFYNENVNILQNYVTCDLHSEFFYNIHYFMNDLNFNRIKSDDYIPSELDILNCRIKTTGVLECDLEMNVYKNCKHNCYKNCKSIQNNNTQNNLTNVMMNSHNCDKNDKKNTKKDKTKDYKDYNIHCNNNNCNNYCNNNENNNQPKFTTKQFKLIDVGGARNERRKWISLFKEVYKTTVNQNNTTKILYFIPLIDFIRNCYEDNLTNRLQESLELFENLLSNNFYNIYNFNNNLNNNLNNLNNNNFNNNNLNNLNNLNVELMDEKKKIIVIFTHVDEFIKILKIFINLPNSIKRKKYLKNVKYCNDFNKEEENPIEIFYFILNKFKTIYSKYRKNKVLKYHVINLLDKQEVNNCWECIVNKKGNFISNLLFTMVKYKMDLKSELFKMICNNDGVERNYRLVDIDFLFNKC